jgi:CRISPR/Cas system CSM-associated protein Csm3 (group 7 of RAMP superfamily)
MNRRERSLLKIMHVAVEALTPISIGSGRLSGFEDSPVTLDVYGLPTIPGTSLSGVLRSLYPQDDDGIVSADELFGFAGRASETETPSWASLLEISNGFIHDSRNRACVSPSIGADGKLADRLLEDLRRAYIESPPIRTRVRINEKGVADAEKSGLFDRTIVPRGTRFTFEVCACFDKTRPDLANATWKRLIGVIQSSTFRIGGATRTGLGALNLVGLGEWEFDLSSPAEFERYRQIAPKLQRFDAALQPKIGQLKLTETIRLNAVDYWRIGNSSRAVPSGLDHEDADLAPYTESCWVWDGSEAKSEEFLLVPASSIKGALRHRTAFHYNRLVGRFIDLSAPPSDMPGTDGNPAVISLFGNIKDKHGGKRGRLLLNDAFIPLSRRPKLQTLVHNSVDRFTGGVRGGALFGEQMIWKEGFDFTWSIIEGTDEMDHLADQAFLMAVDDLAHQRLSLGAAGGRGHGLMEIANV